MLRTFTTRRLLSQMRWLAAAGFVLCVAGAAAWIASGAALQELRTHGWDESLASALAADYRAATQPERFVPINPSIIDTIARDELTGSDGSASNTIAPIFVVGEGNQLPGVEQAPVAPSTPSPSPSAFGHPTNEPVDAATPTLIRTPPSKSRNTPQAGPPTPKPTTTAIPQPTARPTQAHPTPPGGGGSP